jgi:hypothetical protein
MTRVLIGCTSEDEAGEPRLTVFTRVFCCELAPAGFICSLPYRHGGDHEAVADGQRLHGWARA